MRTKPMKLISGLLVLLCILSMQMLAPQLLLAESSLTLTAAPISVAADGFTPSLITAVAGGTDPVANVALTFTTTRGVFSNNSTTINTTTDASGRSIVGLTSSIAGTATVTCSSAGGYVLAVLVNFTPLPTPTPQPTPTPNPSYLYNFVLSVENPTVLVGDLKDIPTITAQLFDQYGKTYAQPNVSIVFTTTPAGLAYFANNLTTITVSTNGEGKASVFLYSKTVGTATVSASSSGLPPTSPVYVNFTGAGSPAYISLSASPNRVPADGTYTAITAFISDNSLQPVAAGTVVTFSTTLGVFQNGKTTIAAATPDDTGTLTVYLRAASSNATGFAVITCTSGTASQSLTVQFIHMEYETEPNIDMAHADGICFDNVYLGQLFSAYDEDWYTFTITTPSRIGINFITTASPADAGCDTGTTTVGTWKADIRDSDNNVLMSRHNVDCIFDNGIWETGVIPAGTYYIVVYCPRLGAPSGDYYLSDFYYMSVFNNFYFPCGDKDKLANSASLSQETSAYKLHVPIIDTTPYLWVDFQYDPIPGTSLMFRLTDLGALANLDNYRACNLSNLSLVGGNYVLHIPVVIYDGVSYRVDLTYVPTTDGQIWFMLSGFWLNK